MKRISRLSFLSLLAVVGALITACSAAVTPPSSLAIDVVGENDTVDGSEPVTIRGTAHHLEGEEIVVTLDDSDADNSPDITKSGVIDSSGNWSVSVTAQEVQILEPGVVIVEVTAEAVTAERVVTYSPPLVLCTNGAAADDNPSLCIRGEHPINGIDEIPLRHVKVTNTEMQRMFLTLDGEAGHASTMRGVLCSSYITQSHDCKNTWAGRITSTGETTTTEVGFTPFTELLFMGAVGRSEDLVVGWMVAEIQRIGTAKIVSAPLGASHSPLLFGSGTEPYFLVNSAGNSGSESLFEDPFSVERISQQEKKVILTAVAERRVLFAAGFAREGGKYIRHHESNGCRDVDQGCLWAPFNSPSGGGTSNTASQTSAAIASVLSVFPDTSYQNLVKIALACAKKTGEGIETLLQEFGGAGVADFSCMGAITETLENLSPGATSDVVIDGKTVTVSERELVVH